MEIVLPYRFCGSGRTLRYVISRMHITKVFDLMFVLSGYCVLIIIGRY